MTSEYFRALHVSIRTLDDPEISTCSYDSVGDLNDDVMNIFKKGVSIHSHPAWNAGSSEWKIHASEMVRRSKRMLEYWHALVVEYFSYVKCIRGMSLQICRGLPRLAPLFIPLDGMTCAI